MKVNQLRWTILGVTLLALMPLAFIAFLLSEPLSHRLVQGFLIMMAGLIAASLSFKRTLKMMSLQTRSMSLARRSPVSAGESGSGGTAANWYYFQALLEDLNLMQQSESLPERYHGFVRIVENCMENTLGPTRVSLWCPDGTYDNLQECVIAPLGEKSTQQTKPSGFLPERTACQVRLDAVEIRQALKTGEAYYAGQDGHVKAPTGAMRCDACIPLYRKYGQPLLVCVQCLPGAVMNARKSDRLEFKTAVELIKMVWNQLQAVNQRQWAVEHEETSGVLRDDVFLERAQVLAEKADAKEELFCVVVLTLHGFRTMFAGQSRLWKDLSALTAMAISQVLKENDKAFLFGRTADDVFVLLLPQTDEFLTRAIMKRIMTKIDEVIPQTPLVRDTDMLALELAWTLADQHQYQGDIQKMLDRIYRRLFSRSAQSMKETHRVLLNQELQEASV